MALSIFLVAILSTAFVLVPVSQQSRQTDVRNRVAQAAQSLLEEIRGTPPDQVEALYHSSTFPVEYAEGSAEGGDVLSVVVDALAPGLSRVTVTGSWLAGENEERLTLQTEIHHP